MHLLPALVLSVLEFCADMEPELALLIMTRTGALHFRNACAHILYRLITTEARSSDWIRIPRLMSEAWICTKCGWTSVSDQMTIVEAVIRAGITVPGRSCPLWCYKEAPDQRSKLVVDNQVLSTCGRSAAVARTDMCYYGWAPMDPDRPGYTASERVQGEKTWRGIAFGNELVLRVHDWDKGTAGIADWVRTAGVGASLWQKAAVYAGSVWHQPDEDLPFRIEPGDAMRRLHPEALKELVAAGFRAPKHYITWAPGVGYDSWKMLYPIFDCYPGAHIGGSYPLFLMLGGPPDLSGPCSMGWIAGGIDLYLDSSDWIFFPEEWGASVQIDGREAFKLPFLRGVVLYVIYPESPLYTELDLEICDIALTFAKRRPMIGCSERSVLSLLTGVVRGWADVTISSERAEKYAARGFEMRLEAGDSAGTRNAGFPEYFLARHYYDYI
jgi:hypothetical protein